MKNRKLLVILLVGLLVCGIVGVAMAAAFSDDFTALNADDGVVGHVVTRIFKNKLDPNATFTLKITKEWDGQVPPTPWTVRFKVDGGTAIYTISNTTPGYTIEVPGLKIFEVDGSGNVIGYLKHTVEELDDGWFTCESITPPPMVPAPIIPPDPDPVTP